MLAIDVLSGDASNVAEVNCFYARFGFGSVAHCGDTLLVARQDGDMTGVVRLCREHGHWVLRGMLVAAGRRHQGIGQRLLAELAKQIAGAPCYALPFRHVRAFYGHAGFLPCPVVQAPAHLQQRYSAYLAQGLDVLIMKRPATARERAHWPGESGGTP